jgi:putative ABC transport system permease protein
VAAPLLRRTAGMPAYLAGRYIRDSGSRTAISVGALSTAVALFVALVIMVHSFRGTVQFWVEQTISGDLFVSGKMAGINRHQDPLDTTIIAGLKALQAPVDIVQNRRIRLKHIRFVYELDVLNMQNFLRHGKFIWLRGDPVAGQASLRRGAGVVVSEVFYHHTGLGVGDSYRAQVGSARIDLPIIGIIRDYRTNGGVVFYDHAAFAQRYFDPGWSGARLFFKKTPVDAERAMADLRTEVLKRCGHHLDMVAGKSLRQNVLRIFDETFAVTTVLLLIALVIAVLGISTTLAVQVLERSRQLNTMFAVGASFGQIRSMVFWEAGMLVLAGESAGLLCGFMLSYILIYVINIQSFGWSFIYAVNWKSLALSLPLIIGMAIPATLPAIHLIISRPPATLLRDR